MKTVPILFLASFTLFSIGTARAAEPSTEEWSGPEVLLESVEKVYSDGKWNGRPALVFWRERFYLFIRTGAGHASTDGAIRLLRSTTNDPRQWETSPYALQNYQATVAAGESLDPIAPGPSATVIIDTPLNEQEVHVLVTPERLFAYTVLEDSETGGVEGTMVSTSDNGTEWSEPEFVYERGWSFWKPRLHDGVYYVAADVMTGDRRVELLSSTDGFQWDRVSTIGRGALTEMALAFLQDGSLLAVARQGMAFKAAPPYEEWTSRKWRTAVDGPGLELVGDTVLVSGRAAAGNFPADDQLGTRRTALFAVNPETLEPKWQMHMLTQWGGDLSYPHILALDDQRAVMVWYDGERFEPDVPKQADIFLAILRIK